MSEHDKSDTDDRLVEAYERMLERTGESFQRAEQETTPGLRHAVERARDSMVELGELTREEAGKVAAYVERDISDAARYIADSGENLRAWWRFDLDLMEERLLDLFALAADQTSVELQGWAEQARQASRYATGEVAGPGTLFCTACGTPLQMAKVGRIPACPSCGGTSFTRAGESEAEGESS